MTSCTARIFEIGGCLAKRIQHQTPQRANDVFGRLGRRRLSVGGDNRY
jgi:hypothetical protein